MSHRLAFAVLLACSAFACAHATTTDAGVEVTGTWQPLVFAPDSLHLYLSDDSDLLPLSIAFVTSAGASQMLGMASIAGRPTFEDVARGVPELSAQSDRNRGDLRPPITFGDDRTNAPAVAASLAVSALPEPSTGALLLAGVGVMGLLARRHGR